MRLEMITRAGCHLCEEALQVLLEAGIEPTLRDVDAEPGLRDEYGWRVPVVLLDGKLVGEGRITAAAVLRALDRS